MHNKIINSMNDEKVSYSNILSEVKQYLEDYKIKSLREIKSMLNVSPNKNHNIMLINREKDLLLFCFKLESFIKGQSVAVEASYFLEDFKRMLRFFFKEELISYIRKPELDSDELFIKNDILLKKLEFVENVLKSS